MGRVYGISKIILGDKLTNRLSLEYKRFLNKPDQFLCIERNKDGGYILPNCYRHVEIIGNEQSVDHLTFHDMDEHAINGRITDINYIDGLDANAYSINHERFQMFGECFGRTYFNLLKII